MSGFSEAVGNKEIEVNEQRELAGASGALAGLLSLPFLSPPSAPLTLSSALPPSVSVCSEVSSGDGSMLQTAERHYSLWQYSAALPMFRQAASQGQVLACLRLGRMYDQGFGTAKDPKKMVYWLDQVKPHCFEALRTVAGKGDAQAQYIVGLCYDLGAGVTANVRQAVIYYRLAADQGHTVAQCDLGLCYYSGRGVAQDDKAAASWFQKAANQGYAMAQSNLGYCYANGHGVTQDDKAMVSWLQKAANRGHVAAQNNLGICYANGLGVTRDDKIAVSWLQEAAEQGNAEAQCNLGSYCYDDSRWAVQDHRAAVKWFQKAAEQGHAEAQYNLGYCYAKGHGIIQDNGIAVSWFQKAAQQGYAKASSALKELLKMSPSLGLHRASLFARNRQGSRAVYHDVKPSLRYGNKYF